MKEHPILFNAEMVRAILDGRKTQTRRLVKPQPLWVADPSVPFSTPDADPRGIIKSPFGTIGDRLWVRETWGLMSYHDPTYWCGGSIEGVPESDLRLEFLVEHQANWKISNESAYWRPSIHMPRWASRIDLEITAVRVERVQDITEEDAIKEGCEMNGNIPKLQPHDVVGWVGWDSATEWFSEIWDSIYGNWDANPWVWVYEFRRVKP
jgi:hypothetical protein